MLSSRLCICSRIYVAIVGSLKLLLYVMGSKILDPGLGLGQDEAQIIAII